MSTELKTKKKWPYLWYDPQTGLPFDFKPDNHPPKSPIATRTTKLREELLKKSSEDPLEPFPRHILTTPTTVTAGTTKTQRLREMLASKILQDQHHRDSSYKTSFKARTPPISTREEIVLHPHKTTNSQRLREEHSRKLIEKRNEDTIAAFMETHRRILSANVDTSPPRNERKRSEVNTGIKKSQKNIPPIAEKKAKTNLRPIHGTAKKSATSLKIQLSQTSSANKKSNKTNLARERYNSEPKLHQKGKTTTNSYRTPVRKQESLTMSTNARKPQVQSLVTVDKVNKAISKNRVNFLKEKMKRLNIDESKNAKKPSYTEECLKMLNQSRGASEEIENGSGATDNNFKVILPPAKLRGIKEPYSPSSKIRRIVQDALSTTGDDDSSASDL